MDTNIEHAPSRRTQRRALGVLVALTLVTGACSLPDGIVVTQETRPTVPNAEPPTTDPTIDDPGGEGQATTTSVAPPPDPNTSELDAHIATLRYDSDELLDVQDIADGSPSARQAGDAQQTETEEGNTVQTCTSTPYSLQTNFSEVAILRPTNGVVFPGALVRADSSLLDGVPAPLGIPQGPVSLSVDLPGIGAAGAFRVENPSNSTVQVAVDESLAWWNSNASDAGNVNAANMAYQLRSAYSSEQAALDVGLNVAWASGDFAGRLSVDSSSERRVTMATFKQTFYTVSVDTPSSPAAMISPDVPTAQALAVLTEANAPAYVASVAYGRILMVRMETSRSVTSVEAEAALNYAAVVRVEGETNARYEAILEESSLEVVTLGGNAAVQSQLIDPSTLREVIQGENAIYSANNPGVPIAYSVHNLNDNSLAKLGYTTEYTATECATDQVGSTVRVTLVRFQAIRDCDGVEGAGEFGFSARVRNRNGNTYPGSFVSESVILSDSEYRNVLHEAYFDVDWEQGESFTVEFTGSEGDVDIAGRTYNDERMNGVTETRTHSYNAATNNWSNNDPQSTGLGGKWPRLLQLEVGEGNCRAELHYLIEFL